ncbi:MAG: hypothetical protein F4Z25_07315, partial [Chloroflexi bacterium]|nr:hypothetical protein [Chloroflexota bacterium]
VGVAVGVDVGVAVGVGVAVAVGVGVAFAVAGGVRVAAVEGASVAIGVGVAVGEGRSSVSPVQAASESARTTRGRASARRSGMVAPLPTAPERLTTLARAGFREGALRARRLGSARAAAWDAPRDR